jgi:hypothetical protein
MEEVIVNNTINNEKVDLKSALRKYFGFEVFKGLQEGIIRNVLDGRNSFVIMPTGGGKSMCYQLPSLIMDGTAIIVSPLIALMKNQVDAIRNVSENDSVAHFLNFFVKNFEEFDYSSANLTLVNEKTDLIRNISSYQVYTQFQKIMERSTPNSPMLYFGKNYSRNVTEYTNNDIITYKVSIPYSIFTSCQIDIKKNDKENNCNTTHLIMQLKLVVH